LKYIVGGYLKDDPVAGRMKKGEKDYGEQDLSKK